MKAVVYDDTRRVAVHEVPDAVIEDPGDVVIRVTSTAICGTDLHMYDGRTGAEPGLVLGHEPVGTIEQVGAAVTLLERGERVAVPTHLFCGLCFNCIRGYTAACLRVRPGGFGAAYGYAGMGSYRGAQAELLHVPYADANRVGCGSSVGIGLALGGCRWPTGTRWRSWPTRGWRCGPCRCAGRWGRGPSLGIGRGCGSGSSGWSSAAGWSSPPRACSPVHTVRPASWMRRRTGRRTGEDEQRALPRRFRVT
jgi:hypothetical protein